MKLPLPSIKLPGLPGRTAVRAEPNILAASTVAERLKKLTGKPLGPSWQRLRKMCRKREFKVYRRGSVRCVLSARGPLEAYFEPPLEEEVVRRVYQALVLASTLPARRCLLAVDSPLVPRPWRAALRAGSAGDRPLARSVHYLAAAEPEELARGLIVVDGEKRSDIPRHRVTMEYRPIRSEVLYARLLEGGRLVLVYAVNLER